MKEQINDTIELTEEELVSMRGGWNHGYYGYDRDWGHRRFREDYRRHDHRYHDHEYGYRWFYGGYYC
jgi:hypothetical protein